MKLAELVGTLGLRTFNSGKADPSSVDVTSAYCGDLLSDVMANVQPNSVWFTVQSHINIIAVAQLRDVACVVLANGSEPDAKTLEKARELGLPIYGSGDNSASMCIRLAGKL